MGYLLEWLPDPLGELGQMVETTIVRVAFNTAARRDFYLDLAEQIDIGTDIGAILESVVETENIGTRTVEQLIMRLFTGDSTAAAFIARKAKKALLSGVSYIQTIQPYIPPDEYMLIAAGADTLANVESLRTATDITTKRAAIRRQFATMLRAPAATAVLVYAALIGARQKIVPLMITMLPAEHWQGLARLFYDISTFVAAHLLLVPLMLLTIAGTVLASLPYLTNSLRIYLDELPPWSIYRAAIGIQTIYTVSIALSAGNAKITSILDRIERAAAPYLASRIAPALALMRNRGLQMGEAFRATGLGFPDPVLAHRLVRYDASPDQDRILGRIAKNWFDSHIHQMERLTERVALWSKVISAIILTVTVTGIYDGFSQITQAIR